MKYFLLSLAISCTLISGWPTDLPAQNEMVYHKVNVYQNGQYLSAYINPYKKSETPTLKGRRYFYYFRKEITSLQAGYQGNLLHGKFERMDTEKRLIEAGNFRHGLKVGIWKQWNQNGDLTMTSSYKSGLKHGKQISYARGGKDWEVDYFKKGKPTGKSYVVENGKRAEVKTKKKENTKKNASNKKKLFNFKKTDAKVNKDISSHSMKKTEKVKMRAKHKKDSKNKRTHKSKPNQKTKMKVHEN